MYDRRRATGSKTIVLAGYLVRFPLGGYFWQAVHYLLGFRALGYCGRAGVDFLRHRLLGRRLNPPGELWQQVRW